MKEAGVEVYYPDKQPFMDKVKPLIEEYKSQPEIWNLIEQIKAIE